LKKKKGDLQTKKKVESESDIDDVKNDKVDTDSPNVMKPQKRKMRSRSSSSSSNTSSSSSRSRSPSPILSKQIQKLSADIASNQNSLKKSSIAELVRKRLT